MSCPDLHLLCGFKIIGPTIMDLGHENCFMVRNDDFSLITQKRLETENNFELQKCSA